MLERMKTHPEEFVASNKYMRAIHRVKPFLTEDEMQVLKDAVVVAHRDYFNGEVLSIIAGENEPPQRTIDYEDTSLASMVMSDKSEGYKTDIARAVFRGMNAPVAPSLSGLVSIKAEGTPFTFTTTGRK